MPNPSALFLLGAADEEKSVVAEYHEALRKSSDMAVAVAAIKALTSVIRNSEALTFMGLEKELTDAANSLLR